MPAGGEDVGEEGEGAFVLGAGGELEGVEVGEGDAEVLGLWGKVFEGSGSRLWGGMLTRWRDGNVEGCIHLDR